MTDTQIETLEALFLAMTSTPQPVRMNRQRAESYANRSGKDFDAWARLNNIQIFSAPGGRREYYTHELAVAVVADYRNGAILN